MILPTARIAHADGPVTRAEYRRAVAQALTLVEQAIAQPLSAPRQRSLQQAADLLDSPREVLLDSGEAIVVNNQELIQLLREPAPSTQSLQPVRARLQALRDALAEAPAEATADEQAKLRDLLSRPPFKTEDDPFTRFINDLLARLFGNVARGVFELRDVIVALGLVLMLLIAIYFWLILRRSTVSESALHTATLADAAHLTSSTALDNAQRFAGAGDYRAAVRQLYLSTLLWLDERGRLRYDRSLTNREYLRAVASTPNVRDALKPIVETFDRIWYGFGPITATEFDQYQRAIAAIREL